MTKGQAVPIIIIVVGIAVIISMFFLFNSSSVITGGVASNPEQENPGKNCREEQVPYEEQEEYMKTEYYTETVPYTDTECESKNLIYKSSDDQIVGEVNCIEDHQECKEKHTTIFGNEKCDRYETVCDKYSESAFFDITNLDSEGGTWSFEWRKRCRGDQPLCNTDNDKLVNSGGLYLDPTESKTSSALITYDAKGQEFLFVSMTSIPQKQVCRDVTKYKEVQKSREVTAYRPVTKYRTETICD